MGSYHRGGTFEAQLRQAGALSQEIVGELLLRR